MIIVHMPAATVSSGLKGAVAHSDGELDPHDIAHLNATHGDTISERSGIVSTVKTSSSSLVRDGM